MKNNTRSDLGKLFAIALIAIGMHILYAYRANVLPFGLVSNDMELLEIWNYTGWLLGILLVLDGILRLLNELLKILIRKLEK